MLFGRRDDPDSYTIVDPTSPASEPFRSLRLAIDLRPEVRTGKALVFTSPEPHDGKSTIAANFALVAGVSLPRVLLVDCDLRQPSQHQIFRTPRAPGVVDVLSGSIDLARAAVRIGSSTSRVDMIPAGSALPHAGDIASSKAMGDFLLEAQSAYDLVVVDAPPILLASDAAGISAHEGVDTILVVRRSGRRRPLVQAVRKLALTDTNVLGLVVNRSGRLSAYAY